MAGIPLGELFKASLSANASAEMGVYKNVLKHIGETGYATGGKTVVDGGLGNLKKYVEASKHASIVTEGAEGVAARNSRNAAGKTVLKDSESKTINGAANKSLGETDGSTYAESMHKGEHGTAHDVIQSRINQYKKALGENPENLKGSIERLQKTNGLEGKSDGKARAYFDTAKNYLTGADLRQMWKYGEGDSEVQSAVLKMGAIRAGAVVGGTALTVGAVRGVGHALFGDS